MIILLALFFYEPPTLVTTDWRAARKFQKGRDVAHVTQDGNEFTVRCIR